jgi:hypothetical protein
MTLKPLDSDIVKAYSPSHGSSHSRGRITDKQTRQEIKRVVLLLVITQQINVALPVR